MGIFNNIKDKSKRLARTVLDKSSGGSSSDDNAFMEWDKVYVEIDDDANKSISNDSETKRRGVRTAIEPDDSQSMYDCTRNASSFAETRNENYDEECGTPSVSNTKSRDLSQAQSSDFTQMNSKSFSQMPSKSFSQMPSKTMSSGMLTNRYIDAGHATADILMPQISQADAMTITKNGKYLANNHFANAQLLRWKHASEVGFCFVQYMAFFSAIAAIFTTVYPVIMFDDYWSINLLICAFHTTTLCIIIIIFEYRICGARNPFSLRARIRNLFERHLNLLRLVWGRGFLYIFAGTMNATMMYYPYCLFTASLLIAMGVLSILMGAHAAFNLERLRLSLTDHSYLWNKFVRADVDDDNLIGIEGFSNLIWSLGLELDDSYTFRAFQEIDQDRDGVINFYEFKLWWIASQDDETIVTMETRNSFLTRKTMDMSKASLAISRFKNVPDEISTNSGLLKPQVPPP